MVCIVSVSNSGPSSHKRKPQCTHSLFLTHMDSLSCVEPASFPAEIQGLRCPLSCVSTPHLKPAKTQASGQRREVEKDG